MLDSDVLQRLFRYSYTLTANEDDAYDLLHDSLERLLRSGPEGLARPESYLRTVIRNRFIDHYRRAQRQREQPVLADISPPDLESVHIDSLIELEQIWPRLEATDREILYFWAYEDYSTREISEKLDLSRGTILSRMHRIKSKISRLLTRPKTGTG